MVKQLSVSYQPPNYRKAQIEKTKEVLKEEQTDLFMSTGFVCSCVETLLLAR
jgi:hypothetical protein